ncbi:hypothetical protein D3C79_769980 [compost metagenome]
MRQPCRNTHFGVRADYPFCIRAVGILASNAKTCERGHEVQRGYDLITTRNGQLIWAQRGETALCIYVEASNMGFEHVHLRHLRCRLENIMRVKYYVSQQVNQKLSIAIITT